MNSVNCIGSDKNIARDQFMHDRGGEGLAREPDHASHVHKMKWEASPKDTTHCAGDSDASSYVSTITLGCN